MKILLCSLIALAVGIAAGVYTSFQEFKGERLPTKNTLAILAEKWSPLAPLNEPKVTIEGGERHDFGVMDRGSKGKHDFVFRNAGTKPLVIEMGETTCKCTAMSIGGEPMKKGSKQTIAPGTSFTVTLDWTVKSAQSNFSQSAEFITNDPRRGIVRLLIHGRAVEAVELSDSSISFPSVTASEPALFELSLYTHRDQELKITKYVWQDSPTKDFLDVTFSPLPKDEVREHFAKGGLLMRVALKPGLPLGTTSQAITLTTNYQGIEPQVIPVSIRIVGDISLSGPRVPPAGNRIALGAVDQSVGLTHTVYLQIKGPHRETTKVEVESVEPSYLRVTLEAPLVDSPNVKRIPLKIEIPAGVPLGNYLGTDDSKVGKINLKTTHPQVKKIDIPMTFLVK